MRPKSDITWRLKEMFVTLRREPCLSRRAADKRGAELDTLAQERGRKPQQSAFSREMLRSNPTAGKMVNG
jgi:transposase-like protein